MNHNTQASALYQSMEKWIELYRDIHKCSHDDAHDAFEAWAEELIGESANQTTNAFHEAVKAKVAEMQKEYIQTFPATVQHHHPETPKVHTLGSMDDLTFDIVAKHVVHHPRGPIGGPLLDTGIDPLAFKNGVRESYFPVDKPHVPLPETVSVEEIRRQAVEILEKNKAYLESPDLYYGELQDEAKRTVALMEMRIEMLDGVLERRKERDGKPLSLKGKHHPEAIKSAVFIGKTK